MFNSLFKKRASVDAVADSILTALTGFDRMQVWGAELTSVRGLQIEKAKEEMFYLDCFAVYVVLKFNDSPGWKQNGMRVFEKVFQGCAITVATAFAGKANATIEEVKNGAGAIDRRFSVYGPIFERSEDTLNAIGVAFARFCQVEGNPVLIRTGADLFNVRGRMLTQFAQEHPIST
jgi:hypothetical protein